VRDEVLAAKFAVSARMNAMTLEERLAYNKQLGDRLRAEGFNVVSRRSSL
jgi:hypothetical protein